MMLPREILYVDAEGKRNDFEEDSQCSDHEPTDEEYAIYSKSARESDGFDVPLLLNAEEFGLIQPCNVTSAASIKLSSIVAKFAIDYFNRTQGADLELVKVIKSMVQVISPLNHYITFIAMEKSTSAIKVYQTLMSQSFPWEESEVCIFREKPCHQSNKAEEVQCLAIFAVHHYNKTEGEDLKYVEVTSFEHLESSYRIFFKAENMLSGDVQIYETEIDFRDPMQNSMVKTFRRSHIQWTNRDEEFHLFTTFAIDYYNKTQGERLKLVQIVTCDQHADSYYITFKARDLLSCTVELYKTEVVYAAPEYNPMVKVFEKILVLSEDEDERILLLAAFAIERYNKTEGERLKLEQIVTCDQQADSYYITFKARDLSTCIVEHYQTEIVPAAPMHNTAVKVFKKILKFSTDQVVENEKAELDAGSSASLEVSSGSRKAENGLKVPSGSKKAENGRKECGILECIFGNKK